MGGGGWEPFPPPPATGRIVLHFKDPAKRALSTDPPHPAFVGTSDGWVDRSQVPIVPEGAQMLELMPALFQAEAGTSDVDDIALSEEVVEPFEVGEAPGRQHPEPGMVRSWGAPALPGNPWQRVRL